MNGNKNISDENHIFNQLHFAQQEINNLRLLNVCLQSTLLRVQTQLIEYIPSTDNSDEIKRQISLLKQTNDHTREKIPSQQISFFNNLKLIFDQNKKDESNKSIPISKNEKQIDILFELFHELNTIIHTEHHDRISQLYITLAQTSHSVIQTHESKKKDQNNKK